MEEKIMNNVIAEENLNEVVDNVIELYPQEATSNLADYVKAGGVCVAVGVGGYLIYKYAVKPALDKRKAKKAEAEQELDIVEEYDPSDVDGDTEK